MSLEAKLEELNASIHKLIDVFANAARHVTGAPAPANDEKQEAAAPAAEKPAPAKREKKQTEGEKAAAALAGTAGDPALYDYEKDVKPKLAEIVAEIGREALMALLAQFGVTKAPDLKQSAYPTVIAEAQKVLDAHRAKGGDEDETSGESLV